MKIDKKLAAILIVCLAAVLILGYIISNSNTARHNATFNQTQTQNVTGSNQTAGQTPEGYATNQTQAPSGNVTVNVTANEMLGGNATNLTANLTNPGSVPDIIINPPYPKNDTNQTNMTCSDTEGSGIEHFFVAGTTTGVFNGVQSSYSDYCAGDTLHYYMCSYSSPPGMLSAGPVANGTYICPDGCSDGACNTETNTSSCTDSDGGFSIYLQGVTRDSSGNISSDYCINSSSLIEYYCMNDRVNGMEYGCLHGCSNGTCTSINISNIYESDFMVVDDSLPDLLVNQPFFEMPPPPENKTR